MLELISRRERMDLFIAWLGITIAFTLAIVLSGFSGKLEPVFFLTIFAISCVTVGIAFVLHEMAHKFTAMKYGFYAEFRKDNIMLLMSVVLAALVHIVFAAPGATVIYGEYLSKEQNGKISAAGPLVNLALCVPFGAMIFLAPLIAGFGSMVGFIGVMGLQINSMIAAFNLLPVSVLDGKKVLAWKPVVFVVMIAISFIILFASLTMVPSYI